MDFSYDSKQRRDSCRSSNIRVIYSLSLSLSLSTEAYLKRERFFHMYSLLFWTPFCSLGVCLMQMNCKYNSTTETVMHCQKKNAWILLNIRPTNDIAHQSCIYIYMYIDRLTTYARSVGEELKTGLTFELQVLKLKSSDKFSEGLYLLMLIKIWSLFSDKNKTRPNFPWNAYAACKGSKMKIMHWSSSELSLKFCRLLNAFSFNPFLLSLSRCASLEGDFLQKD